MLLFLKRVILVVGGATVVGMLLSVVSSSVLPEVVAVFVTVEVAGKAWWVQDWHHCKDIQIQPF